MNEDASKLFEAFFVTKFNIYCIRENLRSFLMEPMNKEKAVDTERKKNVIACLGMVCMYICTVCVQCLFAIRHMNLCVCAAYVLMLHTYVFINS